MPTSMPAVERQRLVKDLYRRGLGDMEIARRLGVSLQTALDDMKAAGVKGGHGGGGGGRWLVSYADFVTLMFGFFLILWASADPNPAKMQNLANAFQKALNAGAMVGQAGTGQVLGSGGRAAPVQISPFQRISEETGELVRQANLKDQVSVGLKREGLVITLSSNLLFDPSGTELKSDALPVLDRIAASIEPTGDRIRVEGHTDNVSPQPEWPSNWELSDHRAAAVARYFTEKLGMPADRFEIAGYAEFHPLAPNDTRENRAKNRRVEIVVLRPLEPAPTPAVGRVETAAKPGDPAGKAVEPSAKPAQPEAKPVEPAVRSAEAAVKPAVPSSNPAEPATKPPPQAPTPSH